VKALLLAAGRHTSTSEPDAYPIFLAEIDGKLIIEWIAEGLEQLDDTSVIFAFRADDVRRLHLDSIARQLVTDAEVIEVAGETAGAPCTALLAVDRLGMDEELLIANVSDLVDVDLGPVIQEFRDRDADAGTVVFDSLHPRYSYVRMDDDGRVIEAAEKNPISRHATAGIYWFRKAGDFVEAAQSMIVKDAQVNGTFYISLTLNELILRDKNIRTVAIDAENYHPFKSTQQVLSFDETPVLGDN